MVWCSLAAIAAAACEGPPAERAAGDSTQVIEEARRFMNEYASELLAGNRAAIAARYDRTGAYTLGNGFKAFQPYDSILASYQSEAWKEPISFEWLDLSFEPIGNNAVVVAGRFR
jgi:hypothetical protein